MEETQNTQTRYKGKLLLIAFVLLVACAGYAYYWYSGIVEESEQAESILQENEVLRSDMQIFVELKDSVAKEYARCQEFITQQEGDFGSFEYCKKFIAWINTERVLR